MTVKLGLDAAVVRRRSRDPDRGRARGRGRRARRRVRVRPPVARRPAEPPARARVLRAARRGRGGDDAQSASARSSRARRCARPRRSRTRFATAQRVSGGRLIAGDRRGRLAEPGRERGVRSRRSARWSTASTALHDAVRAARGRDYPVWVGGQAAQVREIVAIADGWNSWGDDARTSSRRGRRWCARSRPTADAHVGRADLARPGRRRRGRQGARFNPGPHVLAGILSRSRTDRATRRRRGVGDHRPARLDRPRQRAHPRRRRRAADSLSAPRCNA